MSFVTLFRCVASSQRTTCVRSTGRPDCVLLLGPSLLELRSMSSGEVALAFDAQNSAHYWLPFEHAGLLFVREQLFGFDGIAVFSATSGKRLGRLDVPNGDVSRVIDVRSVEAPAGDGRVSFNVIISQHSDVMSPVPALTGPCFITPDNAVLLPASAALLRSPPSGATITFDKAEEHPTCFQVSEAPRPLDLHASDNALTDGRVALHDDFLFENCEDVISGVLAISPDGRHLVAKKVSEQYMSGRCMCAFERTHGSETDDAAPVWEMDDCLGGEKLRILGFLLTPLLLATTDMTASTLRVVSLALRKVVFERVFDCHTTIQSVWCDGEASTEPNGMWLLVKGLKEREKDRFFVERFLMPL